MPSHDLDPETLARLRGGDLGALEVCYREFGPRVQRLCRRLVGCDHADDAAQEVFVKVHERAAQFSGQSRFSTWLYQVTLNHCLKRLERERRRSMLPLSDSTTSSWAEDDLRAVDARDQVDSLLRALSADQRAVIVLRELEGLDYAEIAAVLGLPVGTVMSRLHRARQKLIELERAAQARAPRLGVARP